MEQPILSIVIPTRDRPALCARAVASALAQTLEEIEVIVVDDGGGTPLSFPGAPRVRVVRVDDHIGVCAARNVGLERARGTWITFLDDDDELAPAMAEISIRTARASSSPRPVAVISDVEHRGATGSTRIPAHALARGDYLEAPVRPGIHATLVAPTDLIRSIGGFDPRLRAQEHNDLFIRLNAAASIETTGEALYRVHDHAGPRRHRDHLANAEGIAHTLAKHRAAYRAHRRARARALAIMGQQFRYAGARGRAATATLRSLFTHPFQPRTALWLAQIVVGKIPTGG